MFRYLTEQKNDKDYLELCQRYLSIKNVEEKTRIGDRLDKHVKEAAHSAGYTTGIVPLSKRFNATSDGIRETRLFEKSYSEEDIPEKLVRAFDYEQNMNWEQRTRELEHLVMSDGTGWSADEYAIADILSDKDTLIVVRGKELVELNKLSRVMYDNPDYFVSNHFANYRRVVDFGPKLKSEVWVVTYIIRQFSEALGAHYGETSLLKRETAIFNQNTDIPNFKNVNELYRFIMRFDLRLLDETAQQAVQALRKLAQKQSKVSLNLLRQVIVERPQSFSEEAEWISKSLPVRLPKNPSIYLSDNIVDKKTFSTIFTKLQQAGYEVIKMETYDNLDED